MSASCCTVKLINNKAICTIFSVVLFRGLYISICFIARVLHFCSQFFVCEYGSYRCSLPALKTIFFPLLLLSTFKAIFFRYLFYLLLKLNRTLNEFFSNCLNFKIASRYLNIDNFLRKENLQLMNGKRGGGDFYGVPRIVSGLIMMSDQVISHVRMPFIGQHVEFIAGHFQDY